MPGPTINIFDIKLEAFQQYQSGRRYSAITTLAFRPQIDDAVILHCAQQPSPNPTPSPINTTLTHFIDLDIFI